MKQVDLGFTQLEIHDYYSIVRIGEGVDMTLANHEQILSEVEHEIDGPYGLIYDWINSCSVKADVIEAIRQNMRITCCVVIAYRDATVKSLAVAAEIINKPGTFCRSLDDARQWLRHTHGHR
jgi:hypothetical protein